MRCSATAPTSTSLGFVKAAYRSGSRRQGDATNANSKKLHDLGLGLWVDDISREMRVEGVHARYIADLSVTGLTSNPKLYEHAIGQVHPRNLIAAGLETGWRHFQGGSQHRCDIVASRPPLA